MAEEQFPRNATRERHAARRLRPVLKTLAHSGLKIFEGLSYWENARVSLTRASLEPEILVEENKRRSLRQTERVGILTLLAHENGARGPVETVRKAIGENGCKWTFHRINARVSGFLRKKRTEKLIALHFHYEQFKRAENQNKHAESVAKIERKNRRATDARLFQMLRPYMLEGRDANGRLTFLSEAEERMLEELLDRGKTIKSRGPRLPRSTRALRRRRARRAKRVE